MRECTIILDPAITADSFKYGAVESGWELEDEIPGSATASYEQIWSAGKAGTVHYVEDAFVRVRYAIARGVQAKAVAAQLRELFPHIDEAALFAAAEEDDGDLQEMIDWLMSATVLRDQAGHKRLAKLVEKRLVHGNKAVRRAALVSVSWLEWPEFRATVEKMAKDDPARDVREDAGNLAESYGLRDKGKL